MKKILALLILLNCINGLSAQTGKTIDKKGGSIYYGNYVKEIKSEKDLPENIQLNLNGYLNKILPTIIDSITFSHGQIIDLQKMFKDEPLTYKRLRIIPKYELTFSLKNKSIGIQNYNLEIALDEYGQILETNWPKESIDFNDFKSLSEIESIALNHAKEKNIEYISYEADLIYSKRTDKLIWIINLVIKKEVDKSEFYTIEIPWNFIKISSEGKSYQKTVY